MGSMRWMAVLCVLVACGDPKANADASIDMNQVDDVAIDMYVDPNNPPTLLDTGLCLDAGCTQIAPNVKSFKPQFELYSDGATKRRWIYLPPGTQIDTSNMDFWQFPVGTKVWKEFTRDGVRVETRLVMRIETSSTTPGSDWFYVPYIWNAEQTATYAEPFGLPDANGTAHDVPSRAMCKQCHDNAQPSRVLGFSAIQLDWDNPDPQAYDLESLIADNRLTVPPTNSGTPGVFFPLPGRATHEQPALGYMHANCGHCHNPRSDKYDRVDLDLWLRIDQLGAVSSTESYKTMVGQMLTEDATTLSLRVAPGDPDMSGVIARMELRGEDKAMPPIASEQVDTDGVNAVRAFIDGL